MCVCGLSAQQKIIKCWYIEDTIAFKSIQIGDTTRHYRGEFELKTVIIESDTLREVYAVKNDSLKLFYKCVKRIETAYIDDNQCNGVTLKGVRCLRHVDNLKGIYFCWQHD